MWLSGVAVSDMFALSPKWKIVANFSSIFPLVGNRERDLRWGFTDKVYLALKFTLHKSCRGRLKSSKALSQSSANPITVHFTFARSIICNLSKLKTFLSLETLLASRYLDAGPRAVYIGGCRERYWIIIQIVCITRKVRLGLLSASERGVSLCGLTHVHGAMMYGWVCFYFLFLSLATHSVHITRLFIHFEYPIHMFHRRHSEQHCKMFFYSGTTLSIRDA